MLSACINVCAKSVADSSDSGTADLPSEGGARGRTIEMQFERVRLEKQFLEKTSTTLEEKNRLVVATNDQLNRSNRELRDEVRNLKLENDRIRVQVRLNEISTSPQSNSISLLEISTERGPGRCGQSKSPAGVAKLAASQLAGRHRSSGAGGRG